jgi:hypothetical protein
VLGYYATFYDVDEPALWEPYGSHRVERLMPDDPPERLHSLGVRYVVIDHLTLNAEHRSIQEWISKYDAEIFGQVALEAQLNILPSPPDLYVMRLRN